MNLLENFKEKLSTSLKFVALLSVMFQLVFILFSISKSHLDILFLVSILFYSLIIVIGFSRYLEVKSKNIKEKVINFFWFLNCFPFVIGLLVLVIVSLPMNSEPEEIDPKDLRLIVIDSNGNKVEKGSDEIEIDIKNKKIKDSIIQVKFEE
jgi:hypothetical protein